MALLQGLFTLGIFSRTARFRDHSGYFILFYLLPNNYKKYRKIEKKKEVGRRPPRTTG